MTKVSYVSLITVLRFLSKASTA